MCMVNACWMTTCLLNANLTFFYTLLLKGKSSGFFAFCHMNLNKYFNILSVINDAYWTAVLWKTNHNMNEKKHLKNITYFIT